MTLDWSDSGTLIATAKLNGVARDAIVDTGASAFAISETAAHEVLAGRKASTTSVQTLTGGRSAKLFDDIPMEVVGLPSCRGEVITCPDLDLHEISQLYGREISFVVGRPILERLVLTFDGSQVILDDSVAKVGTPTGTYEITSVASGIPAVYCNVGQSRRLRFCVDTGCDAALSLDRTLAESLCSSGDAKIILKRGQLGPGSPEVLIVREIVVFGTVFKNLPALTGGINVVGFGLLRHMRFTLDFPNKRVLVPDPPQPGRDWFRIDASGLRIVRKEDRLTRIRRIVENSTGDVAGVKLDDVIVAVNGTPALQLSRYEVEEVLSKAGTTVHLDIERDGKPLKIDIPLEHPFEYPPKWPPRPEPTKDQLDFEKFLEVQNSGKAPAESALKPKPE